MSHKEAKKERQEERASLGEFAGKLGFQEPSALDPDPNPVMWRMLIEHRKNGGVQLIGIPSNDFNYARNLMIAALNAVIDFYIQQNGAQRSNLIQVPKLAGLPPIPRH